jgi:hypothetical protein
MIEKIHDDDGNAYTQSRKKAQMIGFRLKNTTKLPHYQHELRNNNESKRNE